MFDDVLLKQLKKVFWVKFIVLSPNYVIPMLRCMIHLSNGTRMIDFTNKYHKIENIPSIKELVFLKTKQLNGLYFYNLQITKYSYKTVPSKVMDWWMYIRFVLINHVGIGIIVGYIKNLIYKPNSL